VVVVLVMVLRMAGYLPCQLVHSSADASPDHPCPLKKAPHCPLLLLLLLVVAGVGVVLTVWEQVAGQQQGQGLLNLAVFADRPAAENDSHRK
jgi:hypothetical protein